MILSDLINRNSYVQPGIYCLSYPAVHQLYLFSSEPWLWAEFVFFPEELLEPTQIRGWGRTLPSVSPNIP